MVTVHCKHGQEICEGCELGIYQLEAERDRLREEVERLKALIQGYIDAYPLDVFPQGGTSSDNVAANARRTMAKDILAALNEGGGDAR